MACSCNTCQGAGAPRLTGFRPGRISCPLAPKASTARRPTCRRATFFCSSCSARFLEQAGMIQLFTCWRHGHGGPRAAARPRCCHFVGTHGHHQGSGVANVVTTGQFTIPLMEKVRLFRQRVYGGVEATSSMGGQIMPPVMGPWPSSWPRREHPPSSRRPGRRHSGHSVLTPPPSGWCTWRPAQEPLACPRTCAPPWRPCAGAGICCCPDGLVVTAVQRLYAACSRAPWAWG